MNYEELIRTKRYDEMTKEEINFCNKEEINYYKPKIDQLKEKGIEDYKIAAYINDLYQNWLIAEIEPLADDVCHISDEDWNKGMDYYWGCKMRKNLLVDDKSNEKKINMEAKYRVDFYYWKCGSGFSHVETIEKTNTIIKANEYVNNIDIDYYLDIPYDAIWVKVVDNENDYVVSEYWWELNN